MTNPNTSLGAIAVSLSILMASGTSLAQSKITTEDFINQLKIHEPVSAAPQKPAAFRGIKIVRPEAEETETAAPAQAETATPAPTQVAKPAELPTLDVRIEFEFGSARLTQGAMSLLDQLGAALMSPALKAYRFELAGHTDATGSASYNLKLSEQRSASVRRYLIQTFDIEPGRLASVGFGESRLLPGLEPDQAAHRRVQITNLGG